MQFSMFPWKVAAAAASAAGGVVVVADQKVLGAMPARFWNEVKSRLQASANSFASTVTQSFRDQGLMFGRCHPNMEVVSTSCMLHLIIRLAALF